MGDAKILSTIVVILFFLAIVQTCLISIISKHGLEGDSKKKIFVFFLIFFFHSLIFFPSIKETSIPNLGSMSFKIYLQEPNKAEAETTWSPAFN